MTARPRVEAVVLSGGGGYAAYEIGVMKALFRGECPATRYQAIEPDIFTGTSGGSMNASVMASLPELPAYAAIDQLERLWLEVIASAPDRCGNGVYRIRGDLGRLTSEACSGYQIREAGRVAGDMAYLAADSAERLRSFLDSNESPGTAFLRLFDVSLLIDSDPLRQLLNQVLRPAAIRASRRCLCITATDWRNGVLHYFWNRDMTDEAATLAVMASSAIPGFFQPVTVGENLYVDGGVLMNTPLKPAIEAGADVLHVIYLDPAVSAIPLGVLQSSMSTMDRMLVTQRAKMINADLDAAVRINKGLYALEQLASGRDQRGTSRRDLVRAAHSVQIGASEDTPFRRLTIHRYHPREDLGGQAGSLNFERERIKALIGKGYLDAVTHDCRESECVMPDGNPAECAGSPR